MSSYDFDSARGRVFLGYLHTVYTSKHFLLNFLPELQLLATNSNLQFAIEEYGDDNNKQLSNLGDLYSTIDESFMPKKILSIRMIALEAYRVAISKETNILERDCAVVLFLQAIDSIEALYLKNLFGMAGYFKVAYQNIREPLDYALDNVSLFDEVHKELLSMELV